MCVSGYIGWRERYTYVHVGVCVSGWDGGRDMYVGVCVLVGRMEGEIHM